MKKILLNILALSLVFLLVLSCKPRSKIDNTASPVNTTAIDNYIGQLFNTVASDAFNKAAKVTDNPGTASSYIDENGEKNTVAGMPHFSAEMTGVSFTREVSSGTIIITDDKVLEKFGYKKVLFIGKTKKEVIAAFGEPTEYDSSLNKFGYEERLYFTLDNAGKVIEILINSDEYAYQL